MGQRHVLGKYAVFTSHFWELIISPYRNCNVSQVSLVVWAVHAHGCILMEICMTGSYMRIYHGGNCIDVGLGLNHGY